MNKKLFFFFCLLSLSTGKVLAQADDPWITIHCDEPGQLGDRFIQAAGSAEACLQTTHLRITGKLGRADGNVFAYMMNNMMHLDLGGVEAEDNTDSFWSCWNKPRLRSIIMPPGLDQYLSLEGCDSIERFVGPTAPVRVGYRSFCGCKWLTSIDLPASVREISNQAFLNCNNLTNVTMSTKVTMFDSGCFQGCSSLTSLTMPDSLEVMSYNALWETALCTIIVPEGCKTIKGGAFGHCPNLTTVRMPKTIDLGASGNANEWFISCHALTDVTLPENLTTLYDNTFNDCPSLTQVNIPASVTSYGSAVFRNCTSLDHILVPAQVTQIGDYCFSGTAITEVTTLNWPAQLTTLPPATFRACEKLQRVDLRGSQVRVIGQEAFSHCNQLSSMALPEGLLEIPRYVCDYSPELQTVIMPTAPVSIGWSAFEGCTKLSHIDLPATLTVIGAVAFASCPIEEVTLPPLVTRYEPNTFQFTKLRHVEVPEGVTYLGDRCFETDSLRSADIPSTIQYFVGYPLGDHRPYLASVTLRMLMPTEGAFAHFGPWENTTKIYVPQVTLAAWKTRFQDMYPSENVLPIDGGYDPGLLVVPNACIIAATNSLSDRKRNVFVTWNESTNWYQWGKLHVAADGQLTAATYRHTHYLGPWYQATSPTLIVDGEMTADRVEMLFQPHSWTGSWMFITVPADICRADIKAQYPEAPFTVRHYDSQARATGDYTHTWKTVAMTDTLRAGEGYFFRYDPAFVRDIYGVWQYQPTPDFYFNAHEGANTYIFRPDDVTLPLKDWRGEFEHNRGWNAVANPWLCYYDIKHLQTEAPILVINSSGFTAVSPLDDDYILRPNEAFFIQRTDELTALTFGKDGRQDNRDVHHAAAKRQSRGGSISNQRVVLDITLQPEVPSETIEETRTPARTRVVVNPQATLRYDRGKDAPFMATAPDGTTLMATALWSQQGGVSYSINERPFDDGLVSISFTAAEAGTYMLALNVRHGGAVSGIDADIPVTLIDQETGFTATLDNPYTFTVSDAGTFTDRFTLCLGGDANHIDNLQLNDLPNNNATYDLQGRQIVNSKSVNRKLPPGIYIRHGRKVIVK